MNGRAGFLAVVLLGGCGGAALREEAHEAAHTPADDARLADLRSQIESLDAELEQATALTGVDCREVCDLSQRICGLADDICEIAEDHPDDGHAGEQCEDARGRCERAGAEATARCGCRGGGTR